MYWHHGVEAKYWALDSASHTNYQLGYVPRMHRASNDIIPLVYIGKQSGFKRLVLYLWNPVWSKLSDSFSWPLTCNFLRFGHCSWLILFKIGLVGKNRRLSVSLIYNLFFFFADTFAFSLATWHCFLIMILLLHDQIQITFGPWIMCLESKGIILQKKGVYWALVTLLCASLSCWLVVHDLIWRKMKQREDLNLLKNKFHVPHKITHINKNHDDMFRCLPQITWTCFKRGG